MHRDDQNTILAVRNNTRLSTPNTGFAGIGGSSGASMIVFGTIAGGAGAALTGGNFWQGAVTGLVVSGLNHALHQNDPPGKKKGLLKKIKDNTDKFSEAAEAGLSIQQLRMIEGRNALVVNDKIGTFRKFSAKFARFAKAGKFLGKINTAATIYNTVSDYNDPNVSSARFSFRLGGTAATIGTASLVGTEFGGPLGTVAGFVVGLGTSAAEIIYDGWNSSVLPVISQGTNYINNNHGYSNFHP